MVENQQRRWAGYLGIACVLAGCGSPDVTQGRYQGMIEYEPRALAFELPGRVTAVLAQRGQPIKAGAPLARQDDTLDRDARALDAAGVAVAQAELALVQAGSRIEDVRAAEAQLASARAAEANVQTELGRERQLVARGATAGARVDALQAELAAATGGRKAQEERLRALRKGARVEEVARATARVAQATQALALDDHRIARRTLEAPADGIVQDVYLQTGEVAGAGVPVLAIADVRRPYADVFVPVADAPGIQVGAPARIELESSGTEVVEVGGVVELVHAEAEFTPRFVFSPRERPNLMVRVRLRIDDREGRLHAGLPAYATIERVAKQASR
jgi:HlyD family secretion protein